MFIGEKNINAPQNKMHTSGKKKKKKKKLPSMEEIE